MSDNDDLITDLAREEADQRGLRLILTPGR